MTNLPRQQGFYNPEEIKAFNAAEAAYFHLGYTDDFESPSPDTHMVYITENHPLLEIRNELVENPPFILVGGVYFPEDMNNLTSLRMLKRRDTEDDIFLHKILEGKRVAEITRVVSFQAIRLLRRHLKRTGELTTPAVNILPSWSNAGLGNQQKTIANALLFQAFHQLRLDLGIDIFVVNCVREGTAKFRDSNGNIINKEVQIRGAWDLVNKAINPKNEIFMKMEELNVPRIYGTMLPARWNKQEIGRFGPYVANHPDIIFSNFPNTPEGIDGDETISLGNPEWNLYLGLITSDDIIGQELSSYKRES